MKHPFEVLKHEYEKLLASATIVANREKELAKACENLLKGKEIYQHVADRTGVPVAYLMATAQREMSGNLHCYLGNGQSLKRKTTIVPLDRGPFLQPFPEDFIAGALDALHIDGLDKVASIGEGWTLARAAYEGETFNGWGYRSHGIPSPYVFGATTAQRSGKFIRDHVYDSGHMDEQLGVIALIEELFKLDKTLVFDAGPVKIEDTPKVLINPVPIGVGGDINVFLLQMKLNSEKVAGTPLKVDGKYGRATTRAVKAYQFIHHLDVDGLVGPKTIAAMRL